MSKNKQSKSRYSVWKIFCINNILAPDGDINVTVLQFQHISKALLKQIENEYTILKIDYSEGKFIPSNIFSMDYNSFIGNSKYSYSAATGGLVL